MPFVKTTFSLVSNDGSLIDPERHCAILATLCRQLGELAQCCDLLAGELVAEIHKIGERTQSLVERTTKLAIKVENLDDSAATIPSCSLVADKTLARRGSVTDYKPRTRRSIFTPSTRPETLRDCYQQCMTSPIEAIAECDIYRTDGRRGATIFSPTIFCLHEHPTDDYMNESGAAVVKRRHTLGRSIKSLRPSNRTRPTSLPFLHPETEPFDLTTGSANDDYRTSTHDVIHESPAKPETVCVDVTGSHFYHQMATSCNSMLQSIYEADSPLDVALNRKTSWRRTICDVSDFQFYDIDADFSPSAFQRDAKSSTTIASSIFEKASVKQLKSSTSRKTSCSWKQSLKSLMRGVRSKSIDLWATSQAQSNQEYEKTSVIRRSYSLPRSLKSKVNDRRLSTGKSKSVDGQLNSTSLGGSTGNRKLETLHNGSATLSRSRGSLLSRSRGRPKSMEVHIVSLDEFGKPFTGSRVNNNVVHINIPEQPWTKPFADVKLRARTTREESDKYQSSSGHWSGEQSFEAEVERFSATSLSSYHVNDSAVSLSCDVTDRSSREDSKTLKGCSSDSTLTAVTSDDNHTQQSAAETVQIQCSPSHHTFHSAADKISPLSTFRRRSNTSRNNVDQPADRSPPPPLPLRSSSSSLDSAHITSGDSATSTEIEKLASLVKKMAAFRAGDKKTAPNEQHRENVNSSTLFLPLQKRTAGVGSHRAVAKVTAVTQAVHRKVTSSSNKSGSRDMTLSLIAESNDETTDDCDWSLTSATWPRPHFTAVTSSSPGKQLDNEGDEKSAESSPVAADDNSGVGDIASEPSRPKMAAADSDGTLTPISARLIISSPVSSRASFVDNPHRRSLCQPLSPCGNQEITILEEPEPSHAETASCGADPAAVGVVPSNYGRSWYDAVDTARPATEDDASERVTILHTPLSTTSLPRHIGAKFNVDVECHSVRSDISSSTPRSSIFDKYSLPRDASRKSANDNSEGISIGSQYSDSITDSQHAAGAAVDAKRQKPARNSSKVHSLKQYKARSTKARQSFSGTDRRTSYNVFAASQSRKSSLHSTS